MTKNKTTKKLALTTLGIIVLLAILFCAVQSKKINFRLTTGIMFPGSAYDVRYNSNIGGMGDGEEELSFKISDIDEAKLLDRKPFGQEWVTGPYSGIESEKISSLSESHQVTNSISLRYSIKYNNPKNIDYDPSYILLVVDQDKNVVLLKKSTF
jgi:hypothetical protein